LEEKERELKPEGPRGCTRPEVLGHDDRTCDNNQDDNSFTEVRTLMPQLTFFRDLTRRERTGWKHHLNTKLSNRGFAAKL
jgi:hypothetical protein